MLYVQRPEHLSLSGILTRSVSLPRSAQEGFGILDPSTTTTQDAIEEWFEQFAPITVVRFRRGRDPFGGKGRGDFRVSARAMEVEVMS
jgi:hypothetical protein